MDPAEYRVMREAEDYHWWYLGMARITQAILSRWYVPGSDLHILDAGCGTGAAMTTFLADYGKVTGIDLSACALNYSARRKAERLAQATVTDLPFKNNSFDLVTSFDVISDAGVGDDLTSLNEFSRILIPGGRVILRLPAYAWLRGEHDKAVLTTRRYIASQIYDLLKIAGFKVEFCSYANMILFPFIALKRLGERFLPSHTMASDLQIKAGPLNGVFRTVLEMESALIKKIRFPFGLTIIIVGRKF
jgi:ubiquinone/menaquinone biosynthesis C-methylase UbiE